MRSSYDKFPVVQITDNSSACLCGWESICRHITEAINTLHGSQKKIVVECYQGADEEEICDALHRAFPDAGLIRSQEAMYSSDHIEAVFRDDITDDEVFGCMTRRAMDAFFDPEKVERCRALIAENRCEIMLVVGVGAAYLCEQADLLLYADMARWEIQQRFRRNEVGNIGADNTSERTALQYKRAFFVDWRICDRFKKSIWSTIDYILDVNKKGEPRMLDIGTFRQALTATVTRPFRVVPFFDPGPWGGQWMKQVCDLDRSEKNFAWCFDCVPEENSLLLGFGEHRFETPSVNLVFAHPQELLGAAVYGRFGDEFPIRFDFLDTMQGGNLSLQVHPLTEYIQDKFGMHYTQDESYYLLDAGDDAAVYLGLRNDVDPCEVIGALKEGQKTGLFDAEKYIGIYPAKKHDHFLIPGGTIHCSGRNAMVLEISATPFIFTFKLWDWGRLGLDGRPRPINIGHGEQVIQWDRTEKWVRRELINRIESVDEGDGWCEERTGLHRREFIETRRHWFTKGVRHKNRDTVNVLNLIDGEEAIVESVDGVFAPFVVHYAETFIVPAAACDYTIRPYGSSEGKKCATIKAFVRSDVTDF